MQNTHENYYFYLIYKCGRRGIYIIIIFISLE